MAWDRNWRSACNYGCHNQEGKARSTNRNVVEVSISDSFALSADVGNIIRWVGVPISEQPEVIGIGTASDVVQGHLSWYTGLLNMKGRKPCSTDWRHHEMVNDQIRMRFTFWFLFYDESRITQSLFSFCSRLN